MKLGLWGARMDNSGLGIQTWQFYKHMKPAKTVVVDISDFERKPERRMKQYPDRYSGDPNVTFITGFPTNAQVAEFLEGLDVVFIAESGYGYSIYAMARQRGIKTACQYNYEFFEWKTMDVPLPDMFIAPSTWNFLDVSTFCDTRNPRPYHIHLHVPVDRDDIRLRYIDSAATFVHVAGRPADQDRNGTQTFLQAIQMSKGDLRGIVYTQDKDLSEQITKEYPRIKVKYNIGDYREIYKKGAVLVMPRKYGGNCLPMNEALAAGMPVIMPRIAPQDNFLPAKWLVDAVETDIHFAPRFKIPVYDVDPLALMLKMRWFASLSTEDMKKQSHMANTLADTISWDEMKPQYEEALTALAKT